jgi:hypothetical protein
MNREPMYLRINALLRGKLAGILSCLSLLLGVSGAVASDHSPAATSSSTSVIQDQRTSISFHIQTEVRRIKEERLVKLRTDYAEQLSKSIRVNGPDDVTDADVEALAGLLSDRDDSVRFWVAASLGYLGPRAKQAVPELQRAFQERECDQGDMTSAPAIRVALSRIGTAPVETPCEKGGS